MPEDYQDLVLAVYKKMRDNGDLHTILTGETTTRLRKACLKIYDNRYNPKDADILSMFFEVDKIECDDFRKVIYDSEPDDYKALCNHIKGETAKTSEENTDLLAWLIDFPTQYEWINLSDEEKKRVFEVATRKKKRNRTTIIGGDDTSTTRLVPHNYIVISCILLLFICGTSFIVWERIPATVRTPKSGENSMYWDGDHYEPVKDGEQEPGVTIIPLNLKTLTKQRKITLPDTLTKYSLGKVWYKGYGKGHEYFTDSGIYPSDTSRRLKPLSTEILKHSSYDRYLLTRLVWFLCAAVFISLCGFAVSNLEKEVKQSGEETKTEKGEIVEFRSNELQATSV
ncbi:hypothetical protein QF042_000457 [Pedobacter sp. W3I1]|uniref:hypothetical protein n=1 Tax=Pedobacter sp. W3I1 TaxID=3042291 RepID=UPI002780D149|nr:hypothetical protein [Pedobacter sp. W3I1]MDQ0636892.1 hypothetical protein [Pedobacter sp. W3I1]